MALGVCLGCAPAQTPATNTSTANASTFLLVRHAEKARQESQDPPLTEAGKARAQALVSTLDQRVQQGSRPVGAIYVTPFKRTRGTATPLATARNLPVREIAEQDVAFIERLETEHRGQTVLVVGHRKTIPTMLRALLGANHPAAHTVPAYGQLFVVTVPTDGPATLTLQHFGSPPQAHSP